MTEHLYTRGFIKNYYQWTSHGEGVGVELSGIVTDGASPPYCESINSYAEMIINATGPSFQPYFGQQGVEVPNDEFQKFHEMLESANKPLYEGCTRHSELSKSSRLLNLKSEFNMP